MSWDTINGDARILPSTGGGADEVKFDNGVAKRLRLILPGDSQPYSYLEHCLEVEKMENGQVTRTFRTIRCPKTTKNPNAPCPLCDGQQVRKRVRHAANVWDYDQSKVQKLNAGDAIFKAIATTRKMGVDVLGVDWGVMKTGEGRNDTEYTCTNLGPSAFVLPADAVLFDIEQEFAPHTIDDMMAIVDSAGGDWDKLIVTPELAYPTLNEALDHEMPNGKYKGQKFAQIWEADKTSRGFINYLATKSSSVTQEKACAQVIWILLGGNTIDGVNLTATTVASTASTATTVANNTTTSAVNTATPTAATTTASTATVSNTTATTSTVASDRQSKINQINGLFSSKEKYTKGGYPVIIQEMQKCGNGKTNIADFVDAELDVLLTTCQQA